MKRNALMILRCFQCRCYGGLDGTKFAMALLDSQCQFKLEVIVMLVRKLSAEFIGTFALLFIGVGALIVQGTLGGIEMQAFVEKEMDKAGLVMSYKPESLLTVALAFGLTIAALVYAFQGVTFHFNPAVTLGLACAGRFPRKYVPAYWLVQVLGAAFAGLLIWGLMPEGVNLNFGATIVSTATSLPFAFIAEAVLTFLLMLVYMSAATDKRFPSAASGLAIGLTIAVAYLMLGPHTGASLNPARSIGSAIFAIQVAPEAIRQIWLYILAPAIGAVAGAFFYESLRPKEFAKNAPEDLIVPSQTEGE